MSEARLVETWDRVTFKGEPHVVFESDESGPWRVLGLVAERLYDPTSGWFPPHGHWFYFAPGDPVEVLEPLQVTPEVAAKYAVTVLEERAGLYIELADAASGVVVGSRRGVIEERLETATADLMAYIEMRKAAGQ
jgi:hypothetical protein